MRNKSSFSPEQAAGALAAADEKVWLEGPAGSGKTSAGVARVLRLLESGVPAESILIFLPQRSLAQPYMEALRAPPDIMAGRLRSIRWAACRCTWWKRSGFWLRKRRVLSIRRTCPRF